MDSSDGSAQLRVGSRRVEPMVWLSAGALVAALLLLLGLLALLSMRGLAHFWPQPLTLIQSSEIGPTAQLGRIIDTEKSSTVSAGRSLLHRGGEEYFDSPLVWIDDDSVESRSRPAEALAVERMNVGPVFGFFVAVDGLDSADQARPIAEQLSLLRAMIGSEEASQRLQRHSLRLRLASGRVIGVPGIEIVDLHAPNDMGTLERLGHFLGSLGRFLSEAPRRSNIAGGVFPAIVGTVVLVLLMAIIVSPLGVLAAVYLQEYAQRGPLTRLVRIAVNNLAGVPSIVYGVFGLGFFVYGVGGSIDALFFAEQLPAPTLGTPGMLWAALTMALLTLPVVIVATEEGLARVPRSLREGSLALGATRAESLLRVVIPAAAPAVLTGLILAIARATGEVAPLLLVGVAKYAPGLPVSLEAPYLHLDRQFMHLGFYIYDLGFQSPYLETAEGLVFATALLLVVIVLLLNISAVVLRSRLRNRFQMQEIR